MTISPTRVERVRLRGDALDPTLARLRLGSLLAGTELRPSGLPPSAVLCVRQIVDPLPGALRLDTAGVRAPPEWERAFVAALERALRSAARPAREAVPAGAEAVLFADRAELLACLARDARDGTAWTNWWWRELRASVRGGGDPVVTAWLETPEHVPAALELLAARGEATRFVAGLSPAAAATLADRVATAFALPQLHPPAPAAVPAKAPVRGGGTARVTPPPEPPWRRIVPETQAQPLAPAAELLLGVSLTLRRSPEAARSPSFAAATRAWLAVVEDAGAPSGTVDVAAANPPVPRTPMRPRRPHPPRPRLAPPAGTQPGAEAEELPAAHAPEKPADHADDAGPARAQRTRRARTPSNVTPKADTAPMRARDVDTKRSAIRPASTAQSTAHPVEGATVEAAADAPAVQQQAGAPDRARPVAAPAPPPWPAPEPEELTAQVVDTQLGGVFYLLQLSLFLELYGDFTRPLEPGLRLSPWDFVALLGRKLLADPSRDDPLWPLLARLAGRRRRARPGAGFRPPRAWRTPKSWLEPFDHDGTWRWSAAGGTLRLVHPAGFPVVAVPRTDEPAQAQLARELRRLRPLAPSVERATLPREPGQALACWVARLAAYADARLRRALDLEPGEALDDVLLRRRARVFVTPTHVDVVLRLADLPLSVRFAGLDRTPGWIPAAGRYVALHFE